MQDLKCVKQITKFLWSHVPEHLKHKFGEVLEVSLVSVWDTAAAAAVLGPVAWSPFILCRFSVLLSSATLVVVDGVGSSIHSLIFSLISKNRNATQRLVHSNDSNKAVSGFLFVLNQCTLGKWEEICPKAKSCQHTNCFKTYQLRFRTVYQPPWRYYITATMSNFYHGRSNNAKKKIGP